MKDEIKEILEKLKENISIVSVEEEHLLLDYITNLQEENERLSVELNQNMIERNDYLSRNEKAIEYFKYQLEQLDFYEDTKAKMLCAMGIVILQGEDKDE